MPDIGGNEAAAPYILYSVPQEEEDPDGEDEE